MDISGKNVLILGQGISGNGAKSALEGICRPYFFVKGNDFGKPDVVVISPGIASHPVLDFAERNNIPVISELELGFLLNRTPVVAITGTNGKTTVTRLIGDMAATQMKTTVCGNIGSAFSLAAKENHEIAVVEASSFQLSRCYEFKPKIAVITNITPDHLDRHGTMEDYISAKFRISLNQQPDDYLILPYDYASYAANIKARIIYSDVSGAVRNGKLYVFDEFVAPLEGVRLTGKHNLGNITQAATAAKLLGISNENIAKAVCDFVPDPHRLQKIAFKNGKNWFDDSKATNIDSCIRAAESMDGTTALILGGSDKGYEYDELFLRLPQNVKEIFVMGDVLEKLVSAAARCKVKVIKVKNLDEAVKLSDSSDVKNVLLSPAAASFDRYLDYKERGRHFEALVKNL